MKERPIIFSGQMVQAILEGKKTQTRRVIKMNPYEDCVWCKGESYEWIDAGELSGYDYRYPCRCILSRGIYGKLEIGDRLWVRETFVLESTRDYTIDSLDEISVGSLIEQNIPYKTVDDELDGSYLLIPHYRATESEPNIVPDDADDFDDRTRWHPSIFMPRWASRITLVITKIRVEKLQEINKKDKYGQSIVGDAWTEGFRTPSPTAAFMVYWDSLNFKRGYGWEKNPWVWVIEFKKLKRGKK